MNIIIAGTRSFNNYPLLKRKMDKITSKLDMTPYKSEVVVFSGAAQGADRLGEQWAKERRLSVKRFHAEWTRLGSKAGPIRNAEMIAEGADVLVAFHDGHSPGTMDMIKQATKAGITVKVIRYDKEKDD